MPRKKIKVTNPLNRLDTIPPKEILRQGEKG